MIIKVEPPKDCSDCVFCEEYINCRLLDRHIEYHDGRASFCPFDNLGEKTVDGVTILSNEPLVYGGFIKFTDELAIE